MTPDDLRHALAEANGEAVPTCLAALDDPGAVVRADWPDQGHVSTSDLLTTYRRRAGRTIGRGRTRRPRPTANSLTRGTA